MSAHEPTPRRSPVDEWWNRAFPALSTRRLLFFLAVYPLIGLLVEAGMAVLFRWLPGEIDMGLLHAGFSWLRYAVLTLSGMGVISLLWLSGSLHQGAAAVAAGAPGAARPAAKTAPFREYRPSWADFATGLPFGTACVLSLLWAIEQPITPATLAASLAGGALVSACAVLRNTVFAPILLSLACGAVIGLFLLLFSMFMSGPQGVLANWAIGTLIAAPFVFPAWHAQRGSLAARLDLPIWVLMSGMLILVASAAVLIRSVE
jgi:hypothetical protein